MWANMFLGIEYSIKSVFRRRREKKEKRDILKIHNNDERNRQLQRFTERLRIEKDERTEHQKLI